MTENGKFEYPLNQIYFYLTEGCNLCCRHCWLSPKYQGPGKKYGYLDTNLFSLIIDEAKELGLSGVKLTGGEPLLHPEIKELIKIVRNNNLTLTMETNGTLCTDEIAARIADFENPIVSVSLDGTDKKTHEWMRGVKGCFEKAINGVKNLVKAGIRTQIIMSITKHNKNQMEELVKLAEELGCDSVKFNIVQPLSRDGFFHKSNEVLSVEELIKTGFWAENELSQKTSLRVIYSHPAAFRPLGKIYGEEKDSGCFVCGIKGIIGVLHDGSYALCGIGEQVPELVFGKAGKDKLSGIWLNHPVINKIRYDLPSDLKGICHKCLMKNQCLGNCIALNYFTSKDLWAPYWYCAMADKKGLFPETRIGI